jgi:hypothetical protein
LIYLAVHAVAPNLAQGALLAIQDALSLAHYLRILYNPSSSSSSSSGSPFLTSRVSRSLELAKLASIFSMYTLDRISRATFIRIFSRLVGVVGAMRYPNSSSASSLSASPANRRLLYRLLEGIRQLPLAGLRDHLASLLPASLKTPFFLWLHRICLGWKYTAPSVSPLGNELYLRLFPHSFIQDVNAQFRNTSSSSASSASSSDSLLPLFKFHSAPSSALVRGSAKVEKGSGQLVDWFCSLMSLPTSSFTGTIQLDLTVKNQREYWNRTFSTEPFQSSSSPSASASSSSSSASAPRKFSFNTVQWQEDEYLIESFGPMQFFFNLKPFFSLHSLDDPSFTPFYQRPSNNNSNNSALHLGFEHDLVGVYFAIPSLRSLFSLTTVSRPDKKFYRIPIPRVFCPSVQVCLSSLLTLCFLFLAESSFSALHRV